MLNIFSIDILRLQLTLEAIDPISLPSYKGSAFHGGFGHALKTISPTWFDYFFMPQTESGNQKPRPFVLLPPLDPQQNYQPGDTFTCELSLFAEATQHYALAQTAIEYLGREMGLGYSRGKFKIIKITPSRYADGEINSQKITLFLLSRLRLKSSNQLQKQAPGFPLLMARLLGRLKTLQQTYSDTAIDEQHYQQLLRQAHTIKTFHSQVHWDEWDRYSGSQKEWMKFGGLLGEISYQGELQAFIPYLQMGEWTHIGGKTSFGLGKYSIKYGEN